MSQDDTEHDYYTTQPQPTTTPYHDIKDNLSNEFSNKLTLYSGLTLINDDNEDNSIHNDTSNELVNSESDGEENFVPFGYEALPQDDDDDDDDIQEENNNFTFQQEEDNLRPKILQIHTSDQEKIPDDDLAVINSIMKNIKLPDTAIPEWAKSIPEEAWLPVVINDNKSSNNM